MESAISLLKLALEKSWSVGLLLVLSCEAARRADQFGIALPTAIIEWAGAGLIFGLAILAVWLVGQLAGAASHWSERQASHRRERLEHQEALKNLSTLDPQELRVLVELLKSGPLRLEVHSLSAAYPLLEKGILRGVQNLGTRWICELHPAIVAHRETLVPEAVDALRRIETPFLSKFD
jgi:hypothetical protein